MARYQDTYFSLVLSTTHKAEEYVCMYACVCVYVCMYV